MASQSFAIKVNNLNSAQQAARLGSEISTLPQEASIVPGKDSAPYAFVNVTGSMRDANSVWEHLEAKGFSVAPRAWIKNVTSGRAPTSGNEIMMVLHRQPAASPALSNHQLMSLLGAGAKDVNGMLAQALSGLNLGNFGGSSNQSVNVRVGSTSSRDGSSQSMQVDIQVVYGQHAGKTKFDKNIKRDVFGNVDGPEYDLSPDGTFKGQNIAILQLYTGESFSFKSATEALQRKGFSVHLWTSLPALADFESQLKRSCQLWVISGNKVSLTAPYIAVIQTLVDLKKGLFIWADNDPFTADANALLRGLTQTNQLSISGNYVGDKVLKEADDKTDSNPTPIGFRNHLITTGIESLYEGITISSVTGPTAQYRTLMRSSDGKVVTACHDRDRCRIIIDGGYTRLLEDKWKKSAGTARFVTNAACWLFNFEGRPQAKWVAARAAANAKDDKEPGSRYGGSMTPRH